VRICDDEYPEGAQVQQSSMDKGGLTHGFCNYYDIQ
jgi:hypothetical protein